jgi:UDP-glucose 4-epimerase
MTGGTGYLGKHLIRKIHNNHDLYFLSRDETDIPKGIDLVIHLAGEVDIRQDGLYSGNLIYNNVEYTIRLIESMIKAGVNKLIYTSSMTVYSINNIVPVKENADLQPSSFYGLTKKWAEEVIQHYSNECYIDAWILRIPGIYGGNRKSGYIYNTIQKALNNEDIVLSTDGMKYWEAIYIDDLTDMIKKMIGYMIMATKVFNISYGEEIDFIETAFKIKQMTQSKSHIKIGDYTYRRFYLDNAKLKELLDFDFSYSFDNGLRRYINEIRNR